MQRVTASKTFFEADDGRKVAVADLRVLAREQRDDVTVLAVELLGWDLVEPASAEAA